MVRIEINSIKSIKFLTLSFNNLQETRLRNQILFHSNNSMTEQSHLSLIATGVQTPPRRVDHTDHTTPRICTYVVNNEDLSVHMKNGVGDLNGHCYSAHSGTSKYQSRTWTRHLVVTRLNQTGGSTSDKLLGLSHGE